MKGIRATIVAEQELIFEPFRLPNAQSYCFVSRP